MSAEDTIKYAKSYAQIHLRGIKGFVEYAQMINETIELSPERKVDLMKKQLQLILESIEDRLNGLEK